MSALGSFGWSSVVTTASTPGAALAAAVSIEVMRPLAIGAPTT